MFRSAVMVSAVLVLTTGILAADPIQWGGNFESAMAQAVETNTPLMVDFVSSGCGFCTMMETETMAAPEVTELAASFVTVKVNGLQRDDLATRYMVAGYPTVVFLTPTGDTLKQVSGYVQVEPFMSAMEDALTAYQALIHARELEAALGEDGGTAPELLAIAREYATANQPLRAADYAQQALRCDVAEVREDALLIRGKALVDMDEVRPAIEPLSQYVAEFPNAEEIWLGKLYLGYACVTTSHEEAGRPVLVDVAENAPEDSRERSAAANLLQWLDDQG